MYEVRLPMGMYSNEKEQTSKYIENIYVIFMNDVELAMLPLNA